MMRRMFALTLLAGLAACGDPTPQQQARVARAVTVACNVDGVVVPIARPVVASLSDTGSTAASADLLVHPAVVAACEAISGVPAAASPAAPPS